MHHHLLTTHHGRRLPLWMMAVAVAVTGGLQDGTCRFFVQAKCGGDHPSGGDKQDEEECSDSPLTLSSVAGGENHKTQQQDQQDQCTLYMAESTIPGAGHGIFTAIERHVDEVAWPGDVAIPLVDFWYHLQTYQNHPDYDSMNPTANYVWYGPSLGMQRESAHSILVEAEYNVGLIPGIDAAVNCNLVLNNVEKGYPQYDFLDLHRDDPGIGGFSPYHSSPTTVLHDIPIGGELFKDYGDNWFINREQYFGEIALSDDYEMAQSALKDMYEMFETNNITDEKFRKNVWDFFVNDLPWTSTRTRNAIPDYDQLELVAKEGIRAAYQPQATKPIHELRTNGRCIDNIAQKPSTIRQAGRGAFATRHVAENSIITGTPVLFFPTDDFFNMYEGNWFTKSPDELDMNTTKTKQLLYNYCWHHQDSSILLCPYGSGINYVNHNQTLANVKLQWAQDGQMGHNASLLKTSPDVMFYEAAPALFLDVVATRDIQRGEEIFMDYGNVWEQAWKEHVQYWETNVQYPTDYISAEDWNIQNPHTKLRTVEEQETEPYPEHFRLTCLTEIDDEDIEDTIDTEFAEELWSSPSVIGYPCRIVDREEQENGDHWYVVEYYFYEDDFVAPLDWDPFADEEGWHVSAWIVREAMRFVDAPYSTNLYLDHVFRQPIGFPDDLFPEAWRGIFLPPLRDLDQEEEQEQEQEQEQASSEELDEDVIFITKAK